MFVAKGIFSNGRWKAPKEVRGKNSGMNIGRSWPQCYTLKECRKAAFHTSRVKCHKNRLNMAHICICVYLHLHLQVNGKHVFN